MSKIIHLTTTALLLAACDPYQLYKTDVLDRKIDFKKQDFETALENQDPSPLNTQNSEDLEVSPLTIAPQAPKLHSDKLVTMTVTDDIALKDVLIELGRMADIDIQITDRISGGINLKVTDTPIQDVLERICESANLRYSISNNLVKIEEDLPYIVNYPVGFLNLKRSNTGSMQISTSLASTSGGGSSSGSSGGSSGGGSSGGGSTSGSSINLTTEQGGDLWTTVENDINRMLGGGSTAASSTTSATTTASTTTAPATTAGASEVYYTSNHQASSIIVSATKKQHDNIRSYLAKTMNAVSSQALIEAKIIEVELNDQFKAGINWAWLDRKIGGFSANLLTNPLSDFTDKTSIATIGILNHKGRNTVGMEAIPKTNADNNLLSVANLMNYFGTTRTLSSPRILATNNQHAVMSFVQNYVYYTLEIANTTAAATSSTTSSTQNITSTLNTIPIGIILNILPSINISTNEITMNVRPTISRVVSTVTDPASVYAALSLDTSQDTSSLVSSSPVVEVKELDSIVKMKSGDVMVLGGLMETRSQNAQSGVPFIGDVPVVGNAFKNHGKIDRTIQTVIFLKATVMPGSTVTEDDKRFYNNFSGKELNRFKFND